jgi:hypothetical protein
VKAPTPKIWKAEKVIIIPIQESEEKISVMNYEYIFSVKDSYKDGALKEGTFY